MARGLNSYILMSFREILKQITYCCYCDSKIELSIDHIVPPKKGGNSHLKNLTKACKRCNSAKGDFPIKTFLANTEIKRAILYNKTLSYTYFLRRVKNGELARYDGSWLCEKIRNNRLEHSRLTRIIKSISSKEYILFK